MMQKLRCVARTKSLANNGMQTDDASRRHWNSGTVYLIRDCLLCDYGDPRTGLSLNAC